jgi:transposase
MNNQSLSNHQAIVGGVDTHKDLHFTAVVDTYDRVLASSSFPTTRHGYKSMLNWMQSFGEVKCIGIECTGTYGVGLLRYLQQFDIEILEVTSPDKTERRKRGKDDTIDAENAAITGIRTVTPKTRVGMVESLRVLKMCRKTAIAARLVALQMIQMNIISVPEAIRESLRTMTRMQLIRFLAAWRPDLGGYREISTAYKIALKSLARRYLELHDEIADLDVMIAVIVDELAPELITGKAIGYESAAQLLITVGDNPERLKSEASFAALCGVNPIPTSSGKINRHRLNRGGDRAANSALHIIAIGRLRTNARTKEYVEKRLTQAHTKLEALRCLKRYIAREVYCILRKRNNFINSIQIAA